MASGKIHVEVLDASGNKVAGTPIQSVMQLNLTRELSGVGSFTLTVPAEDLAAAQALTNERRVEFYVWDDEAKGEKRLLGSGIIRQTTFSRGSGNATLTISGPDILDELKRVNTWVAWTRDDATVGTIIDDLVGLASGWTADTSGLSGLENLSIRLDGASALKGLQEVMNQRGVHFRLGDGKEVEAGAFGDDSGLVIVQAPGRVHQELVDNEQVIIIERLVWQHGTEQVANKIVPLGPGDVEAALTLQYSTRTTPYTVQNMSVNGQTLYYLEDSASVTEYGAIEKVLRASGISALSNSTADLENAANALYDVAANWLERNAVRQDVYRVTARNVRQNLKPGQKVKLQYKGFAVDANWEPVRWVDINEDFWILSATERFDLSGRVVDLELSNVDRVQLDNAQMIIGALDELETQNTVVKPYLSKDTISFPAEAVDSTHDVIFPLRFGDYTARLNQVLLRVWTRPFRSNVTGAASGGDHVHKMFDYQVDQNPGVPYRRMSVRANADLQNPTFGNAFLQTFPGDLFTWGASGNHTHEPIYGIFDDTETPVDVRIYVDDVEVAGGPWATSGEELALELDITSMFSDTGFQGAHEIKVTCGSGQGLVIGQIEVRETIQSIRVI